MEKKEKAPVSIHTSSTEKPVAEIEFYRNKSTLDRTDIISLKVQAPTKEEASDLFTEKLKELELQDSK